MAGGQRDHLAVQLKRNVKFHNGEPFDGAAVKFSIERMLDPKQGAPGRTSIATSIMSTSWIRTRSTSSPAPFPRSHVRMSRATAAPWASCRQVHRPVRRHLRGQPVGTGPFKFVEWSRTSDCAGGHKDYHRGAPRSSAGLPPRARADDARGPLPSPARRPGERHPARFRREDQVQQHGAHRDQHAGRFVIMVR